MANATRGGGLGLVRYDVTTLHFEAETEEALRKVGMSKERRVDPHVQVGLLVDRSGFPLERGPKLFVAEGARQGCVPSSELPRSNTATG